jgi:hypothetical protein
MEHGNLGTPSGNHPNNSERMTDDHVCITGNLRTAHGDLGTDYSYKQIVHLTSNALIVAVQDSCRGSFRLVRANLKCDPIDAEF